ncbi:hypothetical protein RN22_23655 [Grimontia sp. AD028]|uniref:hypothetical protein n=1 Tax=Grimontia sp. AD028 TaxID=1581149 RepID=UPI00061B4B77|nr:hypothetical protein [Grimontia sp. AD028]KKD57962.1 hypothetical protein RN22_23655 [Grimontia sp. AD028]
MKKLLLSLMTMGMVSGCSYVSTYGVHGKLLGTEQQIVKCEYEAALDTLQQFTVIGSNKEKSQAFEFMGVVYQEKMDLEAFNHTVDRYLFSDMGRGESREQVIMEWNEARREIREKRLYELGRAECSTDFA